MTRKHLVTQAMIDLYDEYTHLTLDRRRFIDALAKLAGGTAAAAAIVPLLEARSAAAAIVAADDARIAAADIAYDGASGKLMGYLARPAGAEGPLPAVIVIHENRGLNEHIRDVARRAALAGFLALAPDLLSPAGGTPADEGQARDLLRGLEPEAVEADLVATAAFLRGHELGNGKVGCIGFCWGGGMAGALAVADPELDAAVVFYGSQPRADRVPRIRARLLLHYAGLDERINAGIPDFEAALKEAGTDYQLHMYEGVNHAFHNDTSQARYDAEAASLAWERTIAFLEALA
ncbi:MAG TPA: dienelactone hydrolase family protein [Paracoccaceae bacterium]|nr:dienelactone hydrolase family protein [Paracoccaceae bacterium]